MDSYPPKKHPPMNRRSDPLSISKLLTDISLPLVKSAIPLSKEPYASFATTAPSNQRSLWKGSSIKHNQPIENAAHRFLHTHTNKKNYAIKTYPATDTGLHTYRSTNPITHSTFRSPYPEPKALCVDKTPKGPTRPVYRTLHVNRTSRLHFGVAPFCVKITMNTVPPTK